jgi:hypothetical protein
MSELLVMTCPACKSERRFILPLRSNPASRWSCKCEVPRPPAASFHTLQSDGSIPEEFQALDAIFRNLVTSISLEKRA